jgi:hypothetical protein
LRERHNWAGEKHPPACTCTVCTARRAAHPPVRKKNRPKSLRGKPKTDPLSEALDIFKDFDEQARSEPVEPEDRDK